MVIAWDYESVPSQTCTADHRPPRASRIVCRGFLLFVRHAGRAAPGEMFAGDGAERRNAGRAAR
jgi:hypothetical protein